MADATGAGRPIKVRSGEASIRALERRYETRPAALATPFGADTAAWSAWRARVRARVAALLGIPPEPAASRGAPEVTVHEEVELDDHRRLRISLAARPDVTVPAWVLVPSDAAGRAGGTESGRRPAVIAVHGHGSGVNEIVGLDPDGRPRSSPAEYQHDFALSLVRRGFVVAAPELLGFGGRRLAEDAGRGVDADSCHLLQTWALMLGTTLLGQRVLDLIGVVDILAGHPEVDERRIGIFGISGGATASLMTAILDERIAAVVLSGYMSSFRESVLAMHHCVCNLVPGLVSDLEMADLASALAPRPLFLEAGRRDTMFPLPAVEAAAAAIARAYREADVPDRFALDAFEGEHEISGREAIPFLARRLGLVAPAGAGADR